MTQANIKIFIICFALINFLIVGCPNKNISNTRKAKNSEIAEIDKYRIDVAYMINNNWEIERASELDESLEAAVIIRLMPNGEFKEITFLDKSGNKRLDEAAFKAIEKSNPAKPFPDNITATYIELGLKFGPKGVK